MEKGKRYDQANSKETSMKILAEIGIVLHCPDVLEIVKKHGLHCEETAYSFVKRNFFIGSIRCRKALFSKAAIPNIKWRSAVTMFGFAPVRALQRLPIWRDGGVPV